jgi:endonuclease YncB( thermonuclease family)
MFSVGTARPGERAVSRILVAMAVALVASVVSAGKVRVAVANATTIESRQIEVLDGDTIRVAGETFRLVGFDAPETYQAQCPSERELSNRATFRLRQLVATGALDLERVACACRPEARPDAITVAHAAFSEPQDVMSPTY